VGDDDFTEYVAGRLPRLRQAAYALCGDRHRADDVVQATLVALYTQWRRASAADNLDGYVHRMLVHRFLDEKRTSWARVVLSGRDPRPPATAEPGDAVGDLHAALRRLPPGRRAVLVLRYLCDLSVAETAAVLGCSEGNVKAQAARGIATLRPMLDQETGADL
jgi:RNA polymerase sigma-70 factor (sigma-E family)